MSFDKVGKLIKETHKLSTQYDNEVSILKIINKISTLNESTKAVLCRWVRLGFIEGVKAFVDPMGTITLTDWSSEVDSIIHELLNNGIANMSSNGYVNVPFMMHWPDITDLSPICPNEEPSLDDDIYPSPMVMKVPPSKELIEEPIDDIPRLLAHAIKNLGHYLGGKIVHIDLNIKSLGFINPILFRSTVDVLVVTEEGSPIAHKIIDPSRTVHRGISAVEHYLTDGIDYAVLVHRYSYYEVHVETFNKIVNKPYVRDAGFAIVPPELDYIIFLKWPRRNSIIEKSQSIANRRLMINAAIKYMINAR